MQTSCLFAKHGENQLLGSPPPNSTKLWLLRDEAYDSNHFSHTRNLSDGSSVVPAVSCLYQSLSAFRGTHFLMPNISKWIWDANVTLPHPPIHNLFLLMDFGGNIRGLADWVQSTDLCPLLLLNSAWTPEDLCRSLLGSFLSIPITLCWPVMLCAEWPV